MMSVAVAVITERAIVPGRERLVLNTLKKLQSQAASAPGFISSVAYRDLTDASKLVVISKWNSTASWNTWARQLDRSQTLDEMREVSRSAASGGANDAATQRYRDIALLPARRRRAR
jgi:heme-degrading monooxygenase HmoA